MKHPLLAAALSAALALSASPGRAAEAQAQPPARAASQAHAGAKPAAAASSAQAPRRAKAAHATKAASAPARLVNLNGASAKELKTLPGITDALAARIIAGRPYGSKAQLVTRRIIGEGEVQGLRHLVVARQPYKDAARNAAAQAARKP